MPYFTADISDEHHETVQVLSPEYHSYGGAVKCKGSIVTLKLQEENSALIELLKEPGEGRIAVVDVDRAHYAVVGENLMKLAHQNNWSGMLINGYVRDIHITKKIPVGLWALGTCPRKCHTKQTGERDVTFSFGGVFFKTGEILVADDDGIIVIDKESYQ